MWVVVDLCITSKTIMHFISTQIRADVKIWRHAFGVADKHVVVADEENCVTRPKWTLPAMRKCKV